MFIWMEIVIVYATLKCLFKTTNVDMAEEF